MPSIPNKTVEVKKSPGDKNSYKLLALANGFEALLINSHDTSRDPIAYCSLVVNLGSFNDPPKRPGLAHLL